MANTWQNIREKAKTTFWFLDFSGLAGIAIMICKTRRVITSLDLTAAISRSNGVIINCKYFCKWQNAKYSQITGSLAAWGREIERGKRHKLQNCKRQLWMFVFGTFTSFSKFRQTIGIVEKKKQKSNSLDKISPKKFAKMQKQEGRPLSPCKKGHEFVPNDATRKQMSIIDEDISVVGSLSVSALNYCVQQSWQAPKQVMKNNE